MAGHTPGQWEAMAPKKIGKHWQVGARGTLGGASAMAGATAHWIIARIDNGAPGDTLKTEEANARLIAAAPDLLAVAVAAIEDYEWIIDDHPKLDPDGELPPKLERLRAAIAKATGQPAAPEGAR
jgi:hypothetical protein